MADRFAERHIGPDQDDVQAMLFEVGAASLSELADRVVPDSIKSGSALKLRNYDEPLSERDAIGRIRELASENIVNRSFIGMGYYGTIVPPVIQRNILENPGWYTQYTPYQPEISQGRLEALLNFQTMVSDLTGLPISNASLLDEGTAAAEAMAMSRAIAEKAGREKARKAFISSRCHPQTVEVVRARCEALGLEIVVGDHTSIKLDGTFFGALLQYPASDGVIYDYRDFIAHAHKSEILVTVAADILSLALLASPAELGADIAVGSTQRFGVPMGYGGPHAAYFATKIEFQRLVPGRLVGVSKDAAGNPAIRLALQTREQHIRRERATSNICTAQVLLAVMASMYAVYHGPKGIRRIATEVQDLARLLSQELLKKSIKPKYDHFFDTLCIELGSSERDAALSRALKLGMNLRAYGAGEIIVSLDETCTESDVQLLVEALSGDKVKPSRNVSPTSIPSALLRKSDYLTHPVFNRFHSETEFLRYIRRLESRDLSLCTAMIPLGSCTMKLNATSEMLPVTWAEFGELHPFAPIEQTRGYDKLFRELEEALQDMTGFAAVSLQPNAGSQGEYAGLLVVRAYQESKGEGARDICLIPKSAHGTNPASAVMAGLRVVVVECDSDGNIDVEDLKAKLSEHGPHVSSLMITYPSTHGVFENRIKEVCDAVHNVGAQVYMDGANLNAQVGLCKPAEIGADVLHINLHKTFCIPHGGGGPGMGPIGVATHLAPFLPGHPLVDLGHAKAIGPISAAPWGSAGILPISWMYIAMMGSEGLTRATQIAILNANYVARRLEKHYPVLYRGASGYVAHECIFDLRSLKQSAGIEVEDVAKRLMDYGFHAPTVSFPVPGTLMVEPTESESKEELDRFCEAMIAIRQEIKAIEDGRSDKVDNPLKNAPHTARVVSATEWSHSYSREEAAYPAAWLKDYKFWPAVGRIDGAYGDRNLVCSCPPLDSYQSE